MTEKDFMLRAIELAKLGKGWTNPNPMVGAVIVREDSDGNKKIIAEGYHHKCGDLHAERDALKNAAQNNIDVKGAEIYVTLEPCCHQGRQPPCTQAIIDSGIKKVIIGSRDPNPLVDGKGVKLLEDAGIEVIQNFMRQECDEINPVFFHYIKTKMPYVTVKYAMTLDGETATSKGESKWITGEKARQNVHKTRSESMAVMTGIGTVLKDDPMLNVRISDSNKIYRQPLRVILDSNLKIPLESNLVKTCKTDDAGKVIIFCKENLNKSEEDKKKTLENLGIQVISVKSTNIEENKKNHLYIRDILKKTGELGIDSVFVESGGTLNSSLFFEEEADFVNEVHVYIAPKIFGNDGKTINSPVRGKGIDFPADCIKFSKPEVEFFDEDILLKYRKI